MTEPVAPARRSPFKRLGCALLMILWFAILTLPCGLFYLAANGEIRLQHGDIPQPHAHPRLLISLVSEQNERGLRIESSSVVAGQSLVCVETAVRFLLWESRGGAQDAQFCDCYDGDAFAGWTLQQTSAGACLAAGDA